VIRYVVCCLPALALLAGAGITAAARALRAVPAAAIAAAAAVAAVALLGLPQQRAYRQPWGHGDDIRAAAAFLRAHARPGDAVVYLKPGTRDYADCYPFGFGKLRDIGLASSAVAAGALSGTQAPPTTVANRLRTAVRVWLVAVSHRVPYPAVTGSPRFRLVRTAWRDDILLRLYQRTAWHRRASRTSG
jgi:mannosyltransferase